MQPKEIVASLTYLKAKSASLAIKAQAINLNNGSLITSGQGPYPQIVASLDEMTSTIVNLQSGLENIPLCGKDDTTVVEAYREFVHSHRHALHLLTSKAALFKTGQPVADMLRQEKDILDTLGDTLTNMVEHKAEVKTNQQSLARTLKACIKAHEST